MIKQVGSGNLRGGFEGGYRKRAAGQAMTSDKYTERKCKRATVDRHEGLDLQISASGIHLL